MSNSASRKSLLAQIDKRWLGAGLATAGAAVAADQASAAIVYQAPPGGVNVPSTFEGNYFNVETGVSGFVSGAANPGWDVNPYGAAVLRMFTPAAPGGFVGGGAALYDNLAPGTPICLGDANFRSGVTNINPATPLNLNSANNLFGFRFTDGGNVTRVGWMRMSLAGSSFAQPRTIVEWAYENDPQTCIAAGVPEPGSLALLAAGAAGLVARRRRNS